MKRLGSLALALLAGAALAWWTYTRLQTAPWRPALQSREIATQVLAEHLAKQLPGSKALVFGNPFVQRGGQSAEIYAFESAELRGLQKGFGSPDAIKVVYPDLRPEFLERPQSVFIDPKTTTPLSFLVAENAFDSLIQANPQFELVVSLIGLPVNVRQSRLWEPASKTRLGLLLPDWRMVGGPDSIRQAFTSGRIAAAVISRPGAPPEEKSVPASEYREEFDRRFVLVNKENVDQLLRQFPQLF